MILSVVYGSLCNHVVNSIVLYNFNDNSGNSVVGNSHKENIKQGRIEKYPATTDLAYYRNLVADSARPRLVGWSF